MTRNYRERRRKRDERLQAVYDKVSDLAVVVDAGQYAGGPMEFDPRKGETMIPDCVEVKVEDTDDMEFLRTVSDIVGDEFVVRMPDFKQPGFTFDGRTYYEDRDYEAVVRLVHVGDY